MTILVFCAVLIAALLHASWNGLVKTGDNKQTGMLLLTLAHAFFGLCLIPFLPMPQGEVWVWVLGLGIVMMARGVFSSGEDRKLIPMAMVSACATAGYSLVDGLGARVMGDALAYVSWLLIFAALFYTPIILVLRGRSVLPRNAKQISVGILAGFASFISYAIVVCAITEAPIALVIALRESSILFAMILGWFFSRYHMGPAKILAGIVIVTGVVLTRF